MSGYKICFLRMLKSKMSRKTESRKMPMSTYYAHRSFLSFFLHKWGKLTREKLDCMSTKMNSF